MCHRAMRRTSAALRHPLSILFVPGGRPFCVTLPAYTPAPSRARARALP